jgi:hypothetical protein
LWACFEIAGDEKEIDSAAAKIVSEKIPADIFMRHPRLTFSRQIKILKFSDCQAGRPFTGVSKEAAN